MGVKIAYGRRENIGAAIDSGVIPAECVIITKPSESGDSELLWYDKDCNLIEVSERRRFESLDEAKRFVESYVCSGNIVSVKSGDKWVAHIVQGDKTLSPIENSADVTIIDGGSSST